LTKVLASWVSLPFEPGMIDALQPGLSQAIAMDAPVEFAVVLPDGGASSPNTKPELIVTLGLSSTDKARALLEEHIGQKLVERSASTYVTPEDAKFHCAIAPALGKAASRFVCSDRMPALDHLLPYATRGLPLENLGSSDLHAELRFEPLRQHFGAALRMGRTVAVPTILKTLSLADARFDRPLADVAHAVGDELLDLFEDVDRIAFDIGASAKPEQLEAKMTFAYRGRASLISRMTGEYAHRMSAPNAQFYDLPADATFAAYIAASDPKLADRPRALTEALVEGLLAHFEVAAGLRRDVRTAFETLFNVNSPMVMAYGNAATSEKGTPSATDRLSMALGWRVYGLESPAEPLKAALKTATKLNTDKAFRRGIDELASRLDSSSDVAAKPKTKDKKTNPSDWIKLRNKVVAGMPAGSDVLTVEFTPEATKEILNVRRGKHAKPNAVAEPVQAMLAVVPDGTRTWIVFAMDDKTLLDRSKAVLASSTVAKLSTRTDIAELRGQAVNQAGFATLSSAKGWLQVAMLERGKAAKDADALLSSVPHHGNTPMPYRVVIVGDDKRQSVELTTKIPRAVFDDAAAAVPTLMMLSPE
jgi:hypothetical protein